MSDRIQELQVFVRTAESGSFSRTARELGLSQPTVSRIIAELEARLGASLLLRTTRRVTPTAVGVTFLERARQILRDLADAEDAARSTPGLRGALRVALPATLGNRAIVPRLTPFLRAHPLLSLELMTSDERHDLVAEGADVAIRLSLGPLRDSGFGARKLATGARIVVAAPSYLATRGPVQTPADLGDHDCVFGPGGSTRARWIFTRDGRELSPQVHGRVQITSAQGLVAAVVAGMGIAVLPAWTCALELASGAVVRLLADYALQPFDVYAIYPSRGRPAAKARAFVDYVAKLFPT